MTPDETKSQLLDLMAVAWSTTTTGNNAADIFDDVRNRPWLSAKADEIIALVRQPVKITDYEIINKGEDFHLRDTTVGEDRISLARWAIATAYPGSKPPKTPQELREIAAGAVEKHHVFGHDSAECVRNRDSQCYSSTAVEALIPYCTGGDTEKEKDIEDLKRRLAFQLSHIKNLEGTISQRNRQLIEANDAVVSICNGNWESIEAIADAVIERQGAVETPKPTADDIIAKAKSEVES